MTKSELHSKKRKRPRNRGPSKNHGLSKCNNNHHNNNNKDNDNEHEEQEISSDSAKRMKLKEPSKPSTFLEKMRARLSGGHFRMINEKLYTCTGKEALQYFKKEPSLFDVYHAGYKMQMSNWPEKPVDVIIKWLKKQSPSLVIADFGCGDALIAKSVKNKVFSLDLVSNDPEVIACDMSNTPIVSSSVDVSVFCLSLMGTNYESYIEEANRVLKPGGQLMIAEVKSRFDPTTEGADPEKFSKAISELGFNSVKQVLGMFLFMITINEVLFCTKLVFTPCRTSQTKCSFYFALLKRISKILKGSKLNGHRLNLVCTSVVETKNLRWLPPVFL